MRILDLCCKAGGATAGYRRAFPHAHIVGVDIDPQPNYCGDEFHQADALTFPLDGYDLIHGSPPCKAHTKTGWAYHFGYHSNHADVLTPLRERLRATGTPWVIENVPGAPMTAHVVCCGSQFGLGVRRHRLFETSPAIFVMRQPCVHSQRVVSPHGRPNAEKGNRHQWAAAMDIDWMTVDELAQAIPPAYTEYVGSLMAAHLAERAA